MPHVRPCGGSRYGAKLLACVISSLSVSLMPAVRHIAASLRLASAPCYNTTPIVYASEQRFMPIASVITIDGPAASGKSTLGDMLAQRLGYTYFDTGVLYRALTYLALRHGVPLDAVDDLVALAQRTTIQVLPPTSDDGRQYTVLADGEDITWALRSGDVERHVSQVSAYGAVRDALRDQQRVIGCRGRVVMVGRDIGSVVMPDADFKVFLVASVEERARRRCAEQRE